MTASVTRRALAAGLGATAATTLLLRAAEAFPDVIEQWRGTFEN